MKTGKPKLKEAGAASRELPHRSHPGRQERAVRVGAPTEGTVITSLGLFGFLVNAVAAILLVRHPDGDANVGSVWL